MTDVKELKARIDITELLLELGARVEFPDSWDDEIRVYCPFCSDRDSNKPAGRASQLKQVYHCFACGIGGDIISLAGQHLGDGADITFKQILEWLDGTFPAEQAYV